MYAGHVGIALALRAERGAPPLWVLVLAAQGPDWGDAVLALRGLPTEHPHWSAHSLPHLAIGALVAALVAAVVTGRSPGRAGLLAGLAYVSHWAADLLTGFKPTWPHGPRVGLGWYAFPGRDLALEALVVVAGWWLWRRSLRADRREGPLAWALLAALLGLQLVADVVMARGTLLI